MCNNPSYERSIISFQFAFISVLLSVCCTWLVLRLKASLLLPQQPRFLALSYLPPAESLWAQEWLSRCHLRVLCLIPGQRIGHLYQEDHLGSIPPDRSPVGKTVSL